MPVSLSPRPLPCFQVEKALGGRGQGQDSPSTAPATHASTGRVAGVPSPPSDLSLAGLAAVAAGQPGEAGVKRGRVSEIRGLQVCHKGSHAPCYLQAQLSPQSTVRDSIRGAQAAAHSRQAGHLRVQVLTPLRLCRRAALSAGPRGRLHRLLDGKLRAAGQLAHVVRALRGSGVKPPPPLPAPGLGVMLKPSEPQLSHLQREDRVAPSQGQGEMAARLELPQGEPLAAS